MEFGSEYVLRRRCSASSISGGVNLRRERLRVSDCSGNEYDSGCEQVVHASEDFWKPVKVTKPDVDIIPKEEYKSSPSSSSDEEAPEAAVRVKQKHRKHKRTEKGGKKDQVKQRKGVKATFRRMLHAVLPKRKKKADSESSTSSEGSSHSDSEGEVKKKSDAAGADGPPQDGIHSTASHDGNHSTAPHDGNHSTTPHDGNHSTVTQGGLWPRSLILDQVDGLIPASALSRVFLLYCRDNDLRLLREPFRRTPDAFCDEVQLLADILSSYGGILCQFDGYDSFSADNWSTWAQKMIEDSDFVITVCSPMLKRILREPRHEVVNMRRGKFYADSVANCISPHKFIPVFLNMPVNDDWVPENLKMATSYELHVNEFASNVGDTEGMHPLAFEQKLSSLLENPMFESIMQLVATLRNEPVNPRPKAPPRVIRPLIRGRGLFKAVTKSPDAIVESQAACGTDKGVDPADLHYVRTAHTNVIAVQFDTLKEPCPVHTGDAIVCGNERCTAVLSHLTKLRHNPGSIDKVWVCEFCGNCNEETGIVPEETPKEDPTLYLLMPSPRTGADAAMGNDSLVIFCIDISGSMGVTTEVPGNVELKGHDLSHASDLQSLNDTDEDQFLPHERRDITYVTRLKSVQAAVDHQISHLAETNPTQRVAIVTFGDEVTFISDGSHGSTDVTIAGDKLWKSEALQNIASEVRLPSHIGDSKESLSAKLFCLKEGGQTALGPAVVLSVLLASRVPESKIIICTDGLANKGIGSLEELVSSKAHAAAQTFYADLGLLAQEKGVTVSLVTIKGTDCRIMELGQLVDKTGGEVTIVDPLTITQEFSNIVANPTIATNVTVKIVLHNNLYIQTSGIRTYDSVLRAPVGNVKKDTKITYEYGVRDPTSSTETQPNMLLQDEEVTEDDPSEVVKSKFQPSSKAGAHSRCVPLIDVDGHQCYPFQVQIEYTGHDGSRLMKVFTKTKQETSEKAVAEKGINVKVVGTHAAHTMAALALEGEYSQARISAFAVKKLLKRSTVDDKTKKQQYASTMENMIPLEHRLGDQQEEERRITGHHRTHSFTMLPNFDEKRYKRNLEADDDMAAMVYQMKNEQV